MRTLTEIKNELVQAQNEYNNAQQKLNAKKNALVNPYEWKQFTVGLVVFVFPLAVGFMYIEWNYGVLYTPNWQLEVENYNCFKKIISFIFTPIAIVLFSSIFAFNLQFFVGQLLELFSPNKNREPIIWLGLWFINLFFSKKTHDRMRKIETNDFTNEPELFCFYTEMQERQQLYEERKTEYEDALNDLKKRAALFISSCEDEEVRGFLEQMKEDCEDCEDREEDE